MILKKGENLRHGVWLSYTIFTETAKYNNVECRPVAN
jgi:hypothetical protein